MDTEDLDDLAVRPVDLSQSLLSKLELVWPGKDLVGSVRQQSDGSWELLPGRPDAELYALDGLNNYPDPHRIPQSLLIEGDRLQALRSLRSTLGGTIKLAYVDAPRIGIDNVGAAFRGDTSLVFSAWLSVLKLHLLALEPLLARDGVVVVHVGETEAGAARLLADEVFRGQHIGTVVWQRSYAPRNMRNMKDFTSTHDCLICYAKQKDALGAVGLRRPPEGYDNPDIDPRGPWKAEHKGAASRRENSDFDTFVPPYRWRIVEGRLPGGLWRLSPLTGVIWGKPQEAGEFPLSIEIGDAAGETSIRQFSLRVETSGVAPRPPDIPWLFEEIVTSGSLRFDVDGLPIGIVDQPYSALMLGAGGTPFRAPAKRPGAGRYWEFARDTLVRAYQQDSVYLGRSGPTSIPHPKAYQPKDGELVVENQQTWWPGRVSEGSKTTSFAGFTEDATKHLRALSSIGAISQESPSAKPEMLIARLVDIFSAPDDMLLEVFCQAGDMAAVAIKRNRRFVALSGSTDRDRILMAECAVPRLQATIDGKDQNLEVSASSIRLRSDGYLPYAGGGSFAVASIGDWFVKRRHSEDFPVLNSLRYPAYGAMAEAVLTSQGYVSIPGSLGHGVRFRGEGAAFVVPADEYLTPEIANEWVSKLPAGLRGTLYYFRASPDFEASSLPRNITAKRVPFDLGL